jgi:hypothetical protein
MIIKPGIKFSGGMDWGVILHKNETWLSAPWDLILQNKLI